LLRPMNSKAQTVRPLGRVAEGVGGPPTVAMASSDGSDGTLQYLHHRSEQVRCHTPWPAMTVLSNRSSSL
jgi:hypothetical protein